ncbi:hypothetical protein [Nitrososphaera sp.]|uniref:spermine/spermidine synthase domain-containing protein n=1 Tax=Nitrososphaera sp. TaxID=1971748 RepID=UPI00307F92D0
MAVLFSASLGTILFELALTRIFSIVLWYDYAFMAISVAFFGLGIGSLLVHVLKDRPGRGGWLLALPHDIRTPAAITRKIVWHSVAFAASVPLFILAVTLIPPDTSFIYLYYLASSVPFFFAGSVMALVFLAMPARINKLYFADLVGASSAALLLDPLMVALGAEQMMLLSGLVVAGTTVAGSVLLSQGSKGLLLLRRKKRERAAAIVAVAGVLAAVAVLLVAGSLLGGAGAAASFMEVTPGPNKGLYWQLRNPDFEHLSANWNSFSRVDVTRQTDFSKTGDSSEIRSSRELANIIIDADAGTPIYRWNGSVDELAWMNRYMDYLPYELVDAKNTLVIGSGGGQDILMALAGGARKVTAVELNPLVVSAVRGFGADAGNVYDRQDVELHIDDGRRFVSSSADRYDVITIKLVDSWAAQLAGGYALSENYLYTVEAFQQYLRHVKDDGGGQGGGRGGGGGSGMLAMIRWNFELPRLMPVVAEALKKETGKEGAELARHFIVVEDRPGLYFGRTDDEQKYYPVLVMVKTEPFTDSQIETAKQRAQSTGAEVMVLGDAATAAHPYDVLFSDQRSDGRYADVVLSMGINPRVPTDDSPFYFAREPVPRQMIILLGTVLAISAGLALLLAYHARKNRMSGNAGGSSGSGSGDPLSRAGPLMLFAVLIGLGFMIIEITFIQKFLLLLGTPIMALTVILFSILLSSGAGAYASGRLFRGRPHSAVLASVPALLAIIVLYLFFLQGIIDSAITLGIAQRAALAFGLLAPAGLLMGFQFPSLIGMASQSLRRDATTLLWGINVIASIVGTVLAALLGMIIGFNGNLLIGLVLYAGAGASALAALGSVKRAGRRPVSMAEERK